MVGKDFCPLQIIRTIEAPLHFLDVTITAFRTIQVFTLRAKEAFSSLKQKKRWFRFFLPDDDG